MFKSNFNYIQIVLYHREMPRIQGTTTFSSDSETDNEEISNLRYDSRPNLVEPGQRLPKTRSGQSVGGRSYGNLDLRAKRLHRE